jgi:hypothetical protein
MFAAVTKAPEWWQPNAIAFVDFIMAVMFCDRVAGLDKNI